MSFSHRSKLSIINLIAVEERLEEIYINYTGKRKTKPNNERVTYDPPEAIMKEEENLYLTIFKNENKVKANNNILI